MCVREDAPERKRRGCLVKTLSLSFFSHLEVPPHLQGDALGGLQGGRGRACQDETACDG